MDWAILLLVLPAVGWSLLLGQWLLFRRLTWWQHFACRVLHWHSHPHFDPTGFDGCSIHARCQWCGYEGMIDSQGNLF